jgi:multidrug efflux system outer membrane protein
MRTWASLRVSKTDREIARTNYEKAIQTAFREVADTLAVAGTIDRQVKAQESIVYSTKTIYNLSSERYMQGIDNYLSVLDAQRSLYTAQQSLISLRLTKLANQVKLYEVLGGGSD